MTELRITLSDPVLHKRLEERRVRLEREEADIERMELNRRAGLAVSMGFPKDKAKLMDQGKYDSHGQLHSPLVEGWISERFNRPWLFVSANSGAGKTSLLTYLGRLLLMDGKKVRYYRFSDLLDAVRKPESELYSVDGIVVDDWWRYQWIGRGETQDQALAIVDYLYRWRKILIIGADKPISVLKEETNESVSAQLFGRLRERCGRFVVQLEGKDLRQGE